jgi:pseudouridine-5'-phosphate glycosidase
MMVLRSAALTPATMVRISIIIAAIVVVAILATALFGGPGQGPSFDITTDPAGSYWVH